MMTFLGFAILAVGAFALFMYFRSGPSQGGAGAGERALASRGDKSLASGEKTARTLALNDIVTWMGQDFMVEGKLTYEEDGDAWWEYRLVDGSDVRYLSVEDDDVLEVCLWEEVDLPISGDDPGETLQWQGERYRCTERGKARVRREGLTGRKDGLSCHYWDYEGPGDALLSVERWGGAWEVSSGRPLREGSYEILPGDLVEA